MQDYEVALVNTRVSLEDHKAFMSQICKVTEPSSYSKAKTDANWIKAMDQEIAALEGNGTWIITELPKGHKAISSKWVYKVKFKSDGSLDRYKARLVVKGFNQKLGKDYKHTISPVAKLPTVRMIIALATAKKWPLHQLDVNNAFLHGH